MAAGTFLGVKPEVTAAGLAQADPVVLAMVAAHLQHETTGADDFEGLRRALLLSLAPLLATDRVEQLRQFPPYISVGLLG